MARGKRISDESRAAVVAGLAAGMTIADVASQTGVPMGTVSRMRTEIPQELKKVEETRSITLGDMILATFQIHVATAEAYAKATSDSTYIRSHNPRDVAEMHRSVTEWAGRLLDIAVRARAGTG